ncbi:hypothetical protein HK44_001000 [Pseudomonas fluorescens HK44]|uniref:Uncharacterized protein n=1 Tax=Pseudomonas fluorescens HK44 TaxID=1042209 RepID=A0A010SUQ7_PSEFL|nr:hypothetical protein HK44_001000 [Pseudomonas fluorescens HK44]
MTELNIEEVYRKLVPYPETIECSLSWQLSQPYMPTSDSLLLRRYLSWPEWAQLRMPGLQQLPHQVIPQLPLYPEPKFLVC